MNRIRKIIVTCIIAALKEGMNTDGIDFMTLDIQSKQLLENIKKSNLIYTGLF